MKQHKFLAVGFECYRVTTWRAAALTKMEQVVSWRALYRRPTPYPEPKAGQPPIGLKPMPRLYLLQ